LNHIIWWAGWESDPRSPPRKGGILTTGPPAPYGEKYLLEGLDIRPLWNVAVGLVVDSPWEDDGKIFPIVPDIKLTPMQSSDRMILILVELSGGSPVLSHKSSTRANRDVDAFLCKRLNNQVACGKPSRGTHTPPNWRLEGMLT
jgi:hypothetical protein